MSFDPHAKNVVSVAEGLTEITRGIAAAEAALVAEGNALALRGGELSLEFDLVPLDGGHGVGMRLVAAPGLTAAGNSRVKLNLSLVPRGGATREPGSAALLPDAVVSAEELRAALLRVREERSAVERARAEAIGEHEAAEREHRAAEVALAKAEQLRRSLGAAMGEAEHNSPAAEGGAVPPAQRLADELLGAIAGLDRHITRLALRPSVADALRHELQAIAQAVARGELAAANEALSRFVGANAPLLRIRG